MNWMAEEWKQMFVSRLHDQVYNSYGLSFQIFSSEELHS